jgi:hypothetical protein
MTEQEFLDMWATIEWPAPAPVIFRLYYNEETGQPLMYSMEDLPGKYIDITPEQFAAANFRVKVKHKQIVPASLPLPPKLVPSTSGTSCALDAVDIVVSPQQPNRKWIIRQYEQD